ncbi:uncharacterized protein LOC120193596 [Hibiscus syriacus]|uniref:uncharacterized protein LOC120193596 n=1 Tax=Hibiscus syriacus TaxID=106335 RepID=UPI001922A48C|nr:uncharacterized protein LOC120193596 [Hibiscus syriacus]
MNVLSNHLMWLQKKSLAITLNARGLVSPLCFADDLLIFCKSSIDSVMGVQAVLDQFYSMSGLKLNVSKCEMYVASISGEQVNTIKEIIGFKLGSLPVIYLGVPLVTRKVTVKDCQSLIDKLRTKLSLWANKHLSFAGRLQLILPQAITRKVEQLCSRFFWKGTDAPAKGTRVSWKIVCLLKFEGGLRINDIRDLSTRYMGRTLHLCPKVTWHHLVWFSGRIPKHNIIEWMAILNRLPTRRQEITTSLNTDLLRNWGSILELCCISRGDSSWDGELGFYYSRVNLSS